MNKKIFYLFLVVVLMLNQFNMVSADEIDEQEYTEDSYLDDPDLDVTVENSETSDSTVVYKDIDSDVLDFEFSTDFSATQGKRNWYYMTAPSSCEYGSEDFVMMPMYNVGRKCWGSYNMAEARGWITVDFGAVANYNKVVISETSGKVSSFNIAYSNNNADWTVIEEGTTLTEESVIEFDSVKSRYLKLNVLETEAGPIFNEIAVYNESDAETYPNGNPPVAVLPELSAPTEVTTMPYSKEDLHVYLFIGQSNMNGRDAMPIEEMIVQERAFLLNAEGNWEYAQPWYKENSKWSELQGYNRYSSVDLDTVNVMNPAVAFSRAISTMVPDIGVGIVSNARGGTSVMQWQKGAEEGLYDEAVRRAKIAMQTGTLKGICWRYLYHHLFRL